ncbi:MAG: tetratricopeptide repeat protein [Proteobacteria bacterium]|nr:tetratricopeptide repeat protein [Pseudomonadota bacterium]
MNLQDVFQELDGYFQRNEVEKVEPFLLAQLDKAQTASDNTSALTLLNELMGFYRGMSRFQDSIRVADQAVNLLEKMGYKGSIPYATTLLNVATAYRASGQTAKAIELFEEVGRIYVAHKIEDARLIASLYNNLSLAFQESGDHQKAIAALEMALPLIKSLTGSEVEVAVTYTNLALSKMKCDRLPETKADLLDATHLFENQPSLNPHYSAALAGLGELAYRTQHPQEAIGYYERALAVIEAHYGRNLYYAITLESLAVVYEDLDKEKSQALASEASRIQAALQ